MEKENFVYYFLGRQREYKMKLGCLNQKYFKVNLNLDKWLNSAWYKYDLI